MMESSQLEFILENKHGLFCKKVDVLIKESLDSVPLNFESINIVYPNNLNQTEYLSFNNYHKDDKEYEKYGENFLLATNNNNTFEIWQKIVSSIPNNIKYYLEPAKKEEDKEIYPNFKIGFSQINLNLLNMIKKEIPGTQIWINFFSNYITIDQSNFKISEIIKTYFDPNVKDISLYCKKEQDDKVIDFRSKISCGFKISTLVDNNEYLDDNKELSNDYFDFSVENNYVYLVVWFKNQIFRQLVTNLVDKIDNLENKDKIYNNIKSNKYISAVSKDDSFEYDFNKFSKSLDDIVEFLKNTEFEMCLHYQQDI